MSKYFVLAEKEVGPGGQVYFRKDKSPYNWYNLYLDKVKIGQVMDTGYGRRRWSGLSNAEESEFFKTRMLDGFATRWDAAVFVFKHHGYWMHAERDHARDMVRFEKRSNEMKMNKAYEIMKRVEAI